MRPGLFVGIPVLLAALLGASALAQSPPDVTVVTHGSYTRGRTTDFSIMLSSAVKDVAYLELLIPNSNFVASLGASLLQPGMLLESRETTVAGPLADHALVPGGPYGTSTDVDIYRIPFADSPINGPGELFRLSVFFKIDAFGGEEMGPVDGSGPLVVMRSASDSNGKSIFLTSESQRVRYDFRRFGDVNLDHRLDLADVTALLRAAVGLASFDDATMWYADLFPVSPDGRPLKSGRYLGDGKIDLKDVLTALRVATGSWDAWWPDKL